MEIRVNSKYYKDLLPLWEKSPLNKELVTFIQDDSRTAVLLVKEKPEGEYITWFTGIEPVTSFIEYGYVRIQKFCPLLKKTCIGEKCALYVVQRNIGDCAHVWNALK